MTDWYTVEKGSCRIVGHNLKKTSFLYFGGTVESASIFVSVCLEMCRKAHRTNTSGMPPAERGLPGLDVCL